MQGGDLVRRRAILAGVVAAPWFRVAHGLVAHRISPVHFNGFRGRYGAVDSKQLTCATDDACHGGSARLGRRSGAPASRRWRAGGWRSGGWRSGGWRSGGSCRERLAGAAAHPAPCGVRHGGLRPDFESTANGAVPGERGDMRHVRQDRAPDPAIAIVNAGGMPTSLPAVAITLGQVLDMLSFGTARYRLKPIGADLRKRSYAEQASGAAAVAYSFCAIGETVMPCCVNGPLQGRRVYHGVVARPRTGEPACTDAEEAEPG